MRYETIRRVRPLPGEVPPSFTKQKYDLAKRFLSARDARVETGRRLCYIRDHRLFRFSGHTSMEQYIRAQGLSRSQCYRLMALAEEAVHE